MPAKILLVEDEPALIETIAYNLRREGYDALSERDGVAALRAGQTESPDLVVLDLMLPGMDGLEVCRRLRRSSNVPILMLTARKSEADKILGLELGADDYVTKPFSMRELVARIKAMLRRQRAATAPASQPAVQHFGPFVLDSARHEIRKGDRTFALTPLEYNLLQFLLEHHGTTLSRDQLLANVWGYDYGGDTRTVDVHVRSLREQIEDNPAAPRHLLTVRGIGYRLDLD
jgi:DNA-binding response OmpR family regulator